MPLRALFILVPALILGLSVTAPQAQADDRFPGIRDLMGEESFKAAGLERLSAEEMERLNAWLVHYTAWEASSEDLRSTPAVREARKQPITAALVGPFTGWSGKTRFKLDNGQVWQQRQNKRYRYRGSEDPVMVEISTNMMGFHVLRVVGTNARVGVKRVAQ